MTLSSIYRFIKGDTHVRGKPERRGRQPLLSKGDVGALDRARKRLLKDVDGARTVTHAEIQAKAGLASTCCSRTAEKSLRSIGVRFRAPRRKVHLTEVDAKQRLRVAKRWARRPASFWPAGQSVTIAAVPGGQVEAAEDKNHRPLAQEERRRLRGLHEAKGETHIPRDSFGYHHGSGGEGQSHPVARGREDLEWRCGCGHVLGPMVEGVAFYLGRQAPVHGCRGRRQEGEPKWQGHRGEASGEDQGDDVAPPHAGVDAP